MLLPRLNHFLFLQLLAWKVICCLLTFNSGVPHSQLRHFYLTVIRPVLEYASPVWHHLITKKQSDQIEAIPYHLPLCSRCKYASAIFLADLPTMSDHRDQLARKLFKSTIPSISQFLNYESLPVIFVCIYLLTSPPENQKIPIFLLPCSLPLSDFTIVVS